jgi:hypothetical protein
MDLTEFENFRDWIPVRGYWKENRAFVDWCFLDKERLTEPFFDDSVAKRFRHPFNLLFRHQTPIEFLGDLNENAAGLKPSGFIFHLSRCGSTLISQMLAALPENIVISEASPIDFVLRAKNIEENQRIEWLRWMIGALGQRRNPLEKHYFIKFDCWNTLEINLVRRAFPDVPWIFLYRNPVEIIVSQLRQRGVMMVPGMIREILPELSFEESLKMPPEEFCARVLERICRSVVESLKNGDGLPVNYSELPGEFNSKILEYFKIEFMADRLEKMFAAARFNAKNPQLSFSPDSEEKKRKATEAAHEAARKFVNPIYEAFENIRKKA